MSSYVDMSLEDIIQKKRRENLRGKGPMKGKPNRNPPPARRLPIADARNKIISKKRNQITDAREKLAELAKQKDARLKLEQLRRKRAISQGQGRVFQTQHGKLMRNPPREKEIVFGDPSRQVVSQPFSRARMQMKRQLNNNRLLESRPVSSRATYDKAPRLKPILRTVENDLEMIDDPMGEEFRSPKSSVLNRKANLQLRIVAHNNDARGGRTSAMHRLSTPDKEKSPPRPPSILKKRPMAALRSEKKTEKSEKPAMEYRIIVSNLKSSVTGGDIEELFGDVGGMLESRLVRPGTAEVIYKTLEDAQRAVELYHNRQLDAQPMNCLLVTPRSSTAAGPARNGNKPGLYSTNSNVEPDISTFHKVLFSNF
ncbi:polymerase delta-interacting protein 3-like [Pectinophora gossypiella]|uniref:RRM domain-containing protein n=1 Tax=Pectinophora gossypiella TaxID=13191 RepID=A0A1E1W0Q0_PECGO|nr:polymerase delta-interacting protein 3-like [Pectinophora gossypiella]